MQAVVIGYGSIGKRHLENLSSLFKGDILLCTKQSINEKKFLKIKKITTLNDCINEKPDIALITNETNLHVSTAIKLAKIGCHLFIEKPLSNSTKNTQLLLDLVKKQKITTLMGCNLRFHPCLIKMKQLLSKNKIGKIISVSSENCSYLPLWHKNENYTQSYAASDKVSGGIVLTCIHELDYLYWLFGNVDEVFSYTAKLSDLKIQTDDHASIILKFKNGIIGEIHLDYYQKHNSRYCKIIGTKGILYLDFIENSLKHYDYKNKKWISILSLTKYDSNLMYIEELSHFLKSILNKRKTINDIHEAAKVQKIGVAILKSSKFKKVIKI